MKIKTIIFLLSLCLTLNSCFIRKSLDVKAAKKEFTVENNAIPSGFGKNQKTVILGILRGRRSYDKWLKKVFKKNYHGNYKLISKDDISKAEYSDQTKYRYIFDYSDGTTRSATYSNGQSSSVTYKRFYLYDRLINKNYMSGAEFTYFAKAMAVYVQNLEKKRVSK